MIFPFLSAAHRSKVAPIGWDISTASYNSKSLFIGSQESGISGISFSSDGTKMFIVGNSNNTVYQYTLSTAWDISTASYDSISFSVASQSSDMRDVTFSFDGTKMFVISALTDTVYQYTLSTAWDISTASYDSISFLVASQESNPTGVAFSSDGTKMFILGILQFRVYQYTLSTAWDISTASYALKNFLVHPQDSDVRDLTFSSDGTKMFTVGNNNNTVYQYTLSTAWDISTASYDSISFSVESQGNTPRDLIFSSDGTKMFIADADSDTIYQYTLV